jgi:hypothetical protein
VVEINLGENPNCGATVSEWRWEWVQ